MKAARPIIMAAAILASSAASAQTAVTKEGYAACFSREWLDSFLTFVNAGDTGSMQAYLDQQRCISLRAGVTVTITDSPGVFGGVVGFTFQGVELFAPREALDYGR